MKKVSLFTPLHTKSNLERVIFFRTFEALLGFQLFFIVFVDIYCGLITNRLAYCLFFICSHVAVSVLFGTKFAMSLQKRRPKYTSMEVLQTDLKAVGSILLAGLLRLFAFWALSSFILQDLVWVVLLLDTPQEQVIYVLVLAYAYLCTAFGFFVCWKPGPQNSSFGSLDLKKLLFNTYKLKKLKVFEKKYAQIIQKLDLFVCVLRGISYLSILNFYSVLFLGISFYLDFGRSYALFYFFHLCLVYIICNSSVRNRIFTKYGKDSLRLLGWNMFSAAFYMQSKRVAAMAVTGTGGIIADKGIGHGLDITDLRTSEKFDNDYNDIIDKKRLKYPSKAEEFKYINTVGDLKPKKSAFLHLKSLFSNANEAKAEFEKLKEWDKNN